MARVFHAFHLRRAPRSLVERFSYVCGEVLDELERNGDTTALMDIELAERSAKRAIELLPKVRNCCGGHHEGRVRCPSLREVYPDKMTYVFLDEIQYVAHFEKALDSLFIKPNVDLYITGSNAYFMSGEFATLLLGRYVSPTRICLGG